MVEIRAPKKVLFRRLLIDQSLLVQDKFGPIRELFNLNGNLQGLFFLKHNSFFSVIMIHTFS